MVTFPGYLLIEQSKEIKIELIEYITFKLKKGKQQHIV